MLCLNFRIIQQFFRCPNFKAFYGITHSVSVSRRIDKEGIGKANLISTHNVSFYGERRKIIPK